MTSKDWKGAILSLTITALTVGSIIGLIACEQPVLADISSGSHHVCALHEDGSPLCWGVGLWKEKADPEDGQDVPPDNERFTSITSGSYHSCGLRADGTAVCWGSRLFGQTRNPEDIAFSNISAGSLHTCGVTTDGVPLCWGENEHGESTPPEILSHIPGVDDCTKVLDSHLSGITMMTIANSREPFALRAGDFDGLANLDWLVMLYADSPLSRVVQG